MAKVPSLGRYVEGGHNRFPALYGSARNRSGMSAVISVIMPHHQSALMYNLRVINDRLVCDRDDNIQS